jgi:hypothetical protein
METPLEPPMLVKEAHLVVQDALSDVRVVVFSRF